MPVSTMILVLIVIILAFWLGTKIGVNIRTKEIDKTASDLEDLKKRQAYQDYTMANLQQESIRLSNEALSTSLNLLIISLGKDMCLWKILYPERDFPKLKNEMVYITVFKLMLHQEYDMTMDKIPDTLIKNYLPTFVDVVTHALNGKSMDTLSKHNFNVYMDEKLVLNVRVLAVVFVISVLDKILDHAGYFKEEDEFISTDLRVLIQGYRDRCNEALSIFES